ncbi:hypothetical protein CAC42_5919 [Sphaceloma murrayae]|uniref:Uncharacterized protein n=1 Tax=Sphaceloma murrayae TaxID=2082308 RepID=A0A2K1QZL8_9PEZI|nr:hypothetical protein CAC42_5919 [Sphaceloma murrayae]
MRETLKPSDEKEVVTVGLQWAAPPSEEKEVFEERSFPTDVTLDEKEVFHIQAHCLGDASDEKEVSEARAHLVSVPSSTDGLSKRRLGGEDTPGNGKRSLWTPVFLHRPVIFTFVVVALAILATAEVLNARSVRDQGIASARPNLHYLWTFGPTAILTILAALWNQLDYQMRRNAPLVKMSRSRLLANDSVLLDYLSPWDPQALILGINRKDWHVSLSILGSLVIRLLIVLSTGLFVLKYPAVPIPISLLATDDFSFADLATNASYDVTIGNNALRPPVYNTSYPDGTNAMYASQSFGTIAATVGANSTFEANARVFAADLDCEKADWAYTNRSFQYVDALFGGHMDIDLTSDTFSITKFDAQGTIASNKPDDDWDMSQAPRVTGVDGSGWLIDNAMVNTTCTFK